LTDASIRNAMVVHAAFGGSTNLLLHIPAVAHAAKLTRPTVKDWLEINRKTPRLVSVLPNGPVHHPTVRVFLAGGVPEVMLHLRGLNLVVTSGRAAIAAIKPTQIKAGDVMILAGIGPMGTGMEETYQVTSALKHLPFGKNVAVVTDARFSGVSTGACIGHVGPEALAGGPIGKVLDGDLVQIVVDRNRLEGSVDLVGHGETRFGAEEGAHILKKRPPRPDLGPDPDL